MQAAPLIAALSAGPSARHAHADDGALWHAARSGLALQSAPAESRLSATPLHRDCAETPVVHILRFVPPIFASPATYPASV